jgi:hypothetical protein
MWKLTDPRNEVTSEPVGEHAVRLDIRGFPGWIDCGVLGTLEQVVRNTGCEPALDVTLHAAAHATIVASWTSRSDRPR